MNPYYLYKYPNGLQFITFAPHVALKVWLKLNHKENEYPVLLGIWRVKQIKNIKK